MADVLQNKGQENANQFSEEEGITDYDPVAHRPEGITISDYTALMHLMKASLGAGILFLPNGYRRTGYIASIMCGVAIGLLCTHTSVILVRSSQLLCKRLRVPMLDLAKTVEASFDKGPERMRRYGKKFATVTNVIVCFIHYQACVIYVLYVSTSFQQIIEFVTSFRTDVRLYIVALLPMTCGLALVRNVEYMAPFSIVGTIFLAFGIAITMYYFFRDFPSPDRLDRFTDVPSMSMYCSLFLFALHNSTLFLPLENVMKRPENLPRLITFNMLFNAFIYNVFGFFGYNKYKDACDTVIKNLPLQETLSQLAKVMISLSVFFTFGIIYIVPIGILWPMIQKRFKASSYHETTFRLAGVLMIAFVAIAVPQLVPLIGLLAALSMSTTMLLMPVVIETNAKWDHGTPVLFFKNAVILVIYFVILIFGAAESIRTIVMEYNQAKEESC